MRPFVLVPFVLAFAGLASSAQAAVTLKLDGYQVGNVLGGGAANSVSNAALSRTLGWNLSSSANSTVVSDIAGQFGGTITDGGVTKSFAAYCIELTQSFSPFPTGNLSYAVTTGQSYFSATVYDRIGRLYSENLVLDTADKTAAFQIALWEVIYETSGTLGVGDANLGGTADFRTIAGGTATAATFALAQGYLNAIATTTFDSKLSFLVYTNPNSQDLIVAIPEPSTYALMFAGLAGLGALGVRRARTLR